MAARSTNHEKRRSGWVRESVASTIALAIAAVVLWLMIQTFFSSSGVDDRKEVLQLGLAMFGVVLGYYFGRVPAERRAESADARAHETGQHAMQLKEQLGKCQGSSDGLVRERDSYARDLDGCSKRREGLIEENARLSSENESLRSK